jgi:DNA-binding NarL/FixJ family response regulator
VIRVHIVAEVRLYREGLERVLAKEDGLLMVGSSASAPDAIAAISAGTPDVVLLDLGLPEGLEAARAIRIEFPETKVVALAIQEVEEDVIAWAEVGMAGYVNRDASLADLVATIHRAFLGEMLFPPQIAANLVQHLSRIAAGERSAAPLPPLTARELEIVRRIGEGLSNKEIARALSIALPTVKNHVHNILEKLRIRRRTDAVAYLEAGLLSHSRPLARSLH